MGLYYLCSENKGADQLRGYREADLHLCFRICKKPVFSQQGSFDKYSNTGASHTLFQDEIPLPLNYQFNMSLIRKSVFDICEAQISCLVTTQLISTFVFSTIPVLHKSEISSL